MRRPQAQAVSSRPRRLRKCDQPVRLEHFYQLDEFDFSPYEGRVAWAEISWCGIGRLQWRELSAQAFGLNLEHFDGYRNVA